ncbi:MAG: chaperonin GroEL [Chloroflexota bacterium]
MADIRKPSVVFQPNAHEGMQKGFNQMLNVIRPTLGPFPRIVAYERGMKDKAPELLDDGGVIMRRIIQLPGQTEDAGAMFIRQVLWRLHKRSGDGTATAAVLFQAVYNEGLRFIAAGGNAMLLRRYLEEGLNQILEHLDRMTITIEGRSRKKYLAQVAQTICYDPPMANILGEIFDVIGEYGRMDIRSGQGRVLDREYVEGMYWKGNLLSRTMITDPSRSRADVENAAILITDMDIQDPRDLVPAFSHAVKDKVKTMFIVAQKLSDEALSFINHEKTKEKLQVIAAKTPGVGLTDQVNVLQDMAILTGGQALTRHAGQTLRDVQASDLGRARRVWADKFNFGLSGGGGDPRQVREHIARLREAYRDSTDTEARESLQERIGKLLGGSATFWVGGTTKSEIEARKELAKRTGQALRGAVIEGILPGGGVALLNCRQMLQEHLAQSDVADQKAAYRILLRAIEEPIRTLLSNGGFEPSEVLGEIEQAKAGSGFDLQSQKVVDMIEAGVFDVATVQKDAVRSAITSAALALTIDVMIHHKKPEESMEP